MKKVLLIGTMLIATTVSAQASNCTSLFNVQAYETEEGMVDLSKTLVLTNVLSDVANDFCYGQAVDLYDPSFGMDDRTPEQRKHEKEIADAIKAFIKSVVVSVSNSIIEASYNKESGCTYVETYVKTFILCVKK